MNVSQRHKGQNHLVLVGKRVLWHRHSHRIIKVRENTKIIMTNHPAIPTMSLHTTSPQFLNTSRDSDSSTSLYSLCHCITAFCGKKFFLISNLNLSWCSFRLDIREKLLLRKSGEVLEQTVQGGGGVTDPGGVEEKGECGTEGHCLMGLVGMG